ncbi:MULTISPECIES: ABC transporter ATP-binding protein [Inquilinus]|uniref:NitT/TauT family transport system ATP-binding protein n=1 Tax=Inquilinus ginsengisoli TaxID=363840 RepID=A0ABU1JQ68_9PROT|nr:ABC transporter ATP-binding protein [Inquilinus ginsengisoli]MDR6290771.1 NitT/TauT family transport system ATP-binding protein [Inquilinus ginsengisoli]
MPVARLKEPAPLPDATAQIAVEAVSVTFDILGVRQQVLRDVSLSVPRGSFVCLIGPSGCGKSTLLKVLAGLVRPSEGRVRVAGLAPEEAVRRRIIGLVFQDANLLPWKNALDNAALLREVADKTLSRAEVRDRARAMLKLVGLEDAAAKRPNQLSGGMRQRVAIARALTLEPDILLMDEPFGALDAITREEMSRSLLEIWERTGKTIVLVTHSIDEAVLLSRHVHVMGVGPGRIIDSIEIPLPYPRGEASYADPRFAAMESRLRSLLIQSHATRGRS